MDPVVIEETTLNTTYYNFVEFQPAPGLLIEVLCFQSGNAPINTFDIFRGISDDERSDIAILLSDPVTKVSVVNGTITDSGAATSDDGIVMLHEDDYNNIYWKYHTPAMPLLRRPKKAASVTIEKPKPEIYPQADPAEKAVRALAFGGKTKNRKSRKKLKRKSTKVRIEKP